MRAVAVVTAAGSAERFGGKKLLTPIDDEPLLDHTIDALLDGGVAEVIVVCGGCVVLSVLSAPLTVPAAFEATTR